jgi:hypothetical protein
MTSALLWIPDQVRSDELIIGSNWCKLPQSSRPRSDGEVAVAPRLTEGPSAQALADARGASK